MPPKSATKGKKSVVKSGAMEGAANLQPEECRLGSRAGRATDQAAKRKAEDADDGSAEEDCASMHQRARARVASAGMRKRARGSQEGAASESTALDDSGMLSSPHATVELAHPRSRSSLHRSASALALRGATPAASSPTTALLRARSAQNLAIDRASLDDPGAQLFHQQLVGLIEMGLGLGLMEFQWEHHANEGAPAKGYSYASMQTKSRESELVSGFEVVPFLGCSHTRRCPHRIEFVGFKYDEREGSLRACPVIHVYVEAQAGAGLMSRVYISKDVVVAEPVEDKDGIHTQVYHPIPYVVVREHHVPSTLAKVPESPQDAFRGTITPVTTCRRPTLVPGLTFTELEGRFRNPNTCAAVSEEINVATGRPLQVQLEATHHSFLSPSAGGSGPQRGWRQLVRLAFVPPAEGHRAFQSQPWSRDPVEVGYELELDVPQVGHMYNDATLQDRPRYDLCFRNAYPGKELPRTEGRVRVPSTAAVAGFTRVRDRDAPNVPSPHFTRNMDEWRKYRPIDHCVNMPLIGLKLFVSQYERSDRTVYSV